MRIAQFIDTLNNGGTRTGGAETVVVDLCLALRERGHDPLLLHFDNPYLERRCEECAIAHRAVPGHDHYKSWRSLPWFAWRFSRFLRRESVEALHTHLLGTIVASAPAARLAGIRHVGTLHDFHSLEQAPVHHLLLRAAAATGTHLVTVSRQLEQALRRGGGFTRRLTTIHNGIQRPPPGERQPLRQALAVGDDELLMVCVGRLVTLKGHRLLLDAFAALEGPARLLLVGDGPLRQRLQQQAKRLGIAQRVLFLGERDDVQALLAAADLFVLASETEGLSCSILEAMAAGLPVVATDVGGNPELVEEGVTGLLVPYGDTEALRQALARMMRDDAMREECGRMARRRAEARFSFDAMLERYLALYAGSGIPAADAASSNQAGSR